MWCHLTNKKLSGATISEKKGNDLYTSSNEELKIPASFKYILLNVSTRFT